MKKSFTFLAAGFLAAAALRAADPAPADGPDQGLVITSKGPGESVTRGTETTITFHDTVAAADNDLRMTCDFLQVVVDSQGGKATANGRPSKFKSMLATGNVRIDRDTKVATCGRAEISQNEDTIILSDNPFLRQTVDNSSTTPGPHGQIIYRRGQREAEFVPAPGEYLRTVLPTVKSLDLVPGAKPAIPPPAK